MEKKMENEMETAGIWGFKELNLSYYIIPLSPCNGESNGKENGKLNGNWGNMGI